MKRIAGIVCIVLLIAMAAGCSAPTGSPFKTKAPTIEPTAALETAEDIEMTITFGFGQRSGVYTGQMEDGLPQGEGSFTTVSGDGTEWTYQGEWEHGSMHGYGATVWTDGWSEQGTYENDFLIQGESHYKGVLCYRGEYADDLYHGQGATYDVAGSIIFEGEFSEGYLVENEEQRIARANSFASYALDIMADDYTECLANEEAYIGRKVCMSGEVDYMWTENDSAYAEVVLYIEGNADYPVDLFYRYALDEQLIEEGDWLAVYGIITGVYTYTGSDGYEYAMPIVEAHVVHLDNTNL